jgi:hypothetical protein
MSSVRDSLPIQGLSQWYRESGFPHRKPGLLQAVSRFPTVKPAHRMIAHVSANYSFNSLVT